LFAIDISDESDCEIAKKSDVLEFPPAKTGVDMTPRTITTGQVELPTKRVDKSSSGRISFMSPAELAKARIPAVWGVMSDDEEELENEVCVLPAIQEHEAGAASAIASPAATADVVVSSGHGPMPSSGIDQVRISDLLMTNVDAGDTGNVKSDRLELPTERVDKASSGRISFVSPAELAKARIPAVWGVMSDDEEELENEVCVLPAIQEH
jgi:hypothetical protein